MRERLRKTRVYVAGPYTKPDPCVNTRNAVLAGDSLWCQGYSVFIPHLTHLWHLIAPHSYEEWMEIDEDWLKACDVMLRLPGESSGADREAGVAAKLGIPIYYSEKELLDAQPPQMRIM